jgi:hypothetical protein
MARGIAASSSPPQSITDQASEASTDFFPRFKGSHQSRRLLQGNVFQQKGYLHPEGFIQYRFVCSPTVLKAWKHFQSDF